MPALSKNRTRSVVAGAVAVTVLAAAVLLAATAHRGLPGTTQTTVKVAFTDVGTLRVHDAVRIGGVRVGQVQDIAYTDGQAVAELALTEVDTVYRNAGAVSAAVGARSALGAKYVDLDPGTPDAGELKQGEVLPATQTSAAQDITELLDVLDEPTRDALGSFLRESGGGFAGQEANIDDAVRALPRELPDLATVARALSHSGGTDTVRMMRAVDTLAGRFEGRGRQIAEMTSRLGATLQAVGVDNADPLRDTLDRAPETARRVRQSLAKLDEPLARTESAMIALRPGGQALAKALPDTRGVLREAPVTLDKVPGVAGQASPALKQLTGLMADARPLAPKLTRAFDDAADPLAVLAPYSAEVAAAFTALKRVLEGHDAPDRHWLNIMLVPTSELLGTGMLGRDPLVARDPYPAPGQASRNRQTELFGTGGK